MTSQQLAGRARREVNSVHGAGRTRTLPNDGAGRAGQRRSGQWSGCTLITLFSEAQWSIQQRAAAALHAAKGSERAVGIGLTYHGACNRDRVRGSGEGWARAL